MQHRYLTFILTTLTILASCSGETEQQPVALNGKQLADKYLLVDTHIDVPYRLHRTPQDVGIATEAGEFDYPRAIAGGAECRLYVYLYTRPGGRSGWC